MASDGDLKNIRQNLTSSDKPSQHTLSNIRTNVNNSTKTELSTYGLQSVNESANPSINTETED